MTVQYQRSTVYTMDDVQAIADHAGSYFFSPGAMKAFSSRILEGVHAAKSNEHGNDAVPGAKFYFVTSEKYPESPRHYAVRAFTLGTVRDDRPSVDIFTSGDEWTTARAARKAAAELAEEN